MQLCGESKGVAGIPVLFFPDETRMKAGDFCFRGIKPAARSGQEENDIRLIFQEDMHNIGKIDKIGKISKKIPPFEKKYPSLPPGRSFCISKRRTKKARFSNEKFPIFSIFPRFPKRV